MVNKTVLSCLLKDGKEVNAVMLVGRLFHARATVTRNDLVADGAEPGSRNDQAWTGTGP